MKSLGSRWPAARDVPARRRPVLFVLAAIAVATATLAAARLTSQAAASSRSIVLVSDLHFGEGRDASGAWHPYEDFRWPDEFAAFLQTIGENGKGSVDLVLNGDTFELLQSSRAGCGSIPDLGCSDGEAMARVQRVLAAHDAEMKALAQFARSGSNRVIFVPGDHDAALLFPLIGRRVASALAAPAGRVEVAARGYWLSSDGKVYAEHGHQIGFSAHRFEHWPQVIVRRDGRDRLARPWGERTIQDIYNRLELQYPIIDNIALAGMGVKYALAAEKDSDTGGASGVPALLRYLLFLTSWQQFRMELDGGEVQPPTWDMTQVRAQGASFLVSALPDDDPFKPVAARALAEGHLARSMEELSDDELTMICDYRAALRRSRRRFEQFVSQFTPRGPVIPECPRTPDTRGSIFDYFWRSRDLMYMRHIEAVTRQLPTKTQPLVVVQGHTHLADRSQSNANAISGGLLTIPPEGFSPARGTLTPNVVNGGAWQRTMTPVQLERLKTERALPERDFLRSLSPEDLPPCYSFVHVPAYTDTPAPRVRYWRRDARGEWALGAGCVP
jgi:UDP-2,3-diacylglucosamine pyrophosphatase LpxH